MYRDNRRNDTVMFLPVGRSDAQCIDFPGSYDCLVVGADSRLFFK